MNSYVFYQVCFVAKETNARSKGRLDSLEIRSGQIKAQINNSEIFYLMSFNEIYRYII